MTRPLRPALRRFVARAFSLFTGRQPGLRILTYHRVNDRHPHDRLTVHPDAFAAQMEALRRSLRPVVPLGQSLPALRGAAPLPAGALALTFDDGYEDNLAHALPILDRYSFPATFFVVSGLMGTGDTLDRYRGCCNADRMLDWSQVQELRAHGHTVGGHGRTHRELAGLPATEVRAEAEECAREIERGAGKRPTLFCYPRGSENVAVRRIVGEAGYEAACTVRPGANAPGIDLHSLRRTEVSGDDTLEDFRFKLDGGFDAWHRAAQRFRARGPR
jgi:peptidoglycan/xylan/chitin deacetylase (PgdA/CDA1 family)